MPVEIPDPTADDDHIRDRIINALGKNDWCPHGLSVIVRDGIVHLSGIITDERSRQAAIVCAENIAGVKKVHDHLCWVDPMSGHVLHRTGRRGTGEGELGRRSAVRAYSSVFSFRYSSGTCPNRRSTCL